MDAIDDLIEKLKRSPLFYLFLSSRELFHSNFWFWLSTINKTETLKLFTGEIPTAEIESVQREVNKKVGIDKSKVDLLFTLSDGRQILIENKVKDFPTMSQLSRIQRSCGSEDVDFILVSLFPTTNQRFDGWKVISYEQLSQVIDSRDFTDNTFHIELINEYKIFISDLSELIRQLPFTDSYDFGLSHSADLFRKLNVVKLWEGYQKLRASFIVQKFNSPNNPIIADYSLNNKKATLHFPVKLDDDYEIGIQIEDNQFRKFVQGPNAHIFAENLLKKGLFFDVKIVNRGKEILSYGNYFKYRHTKIGPITNNDLFKKIEHEFEMIRLKWDSILQQIP